MGNVESNGLMYAMPFPVIVWHGTKDFLLSFSAKDITPVLPGNIWTLFLIISGIETSFMYNFLGSLVLLYHVGTSQLGNVWSC